LLNCLGNTGKFCVAHKFLPENVAPGVERQKEGNDSETQLFRRTTKPHLAAIDCLSTLEIRGKRLPENREL
jgi:hypothetical protein